jgi:predicted O-methyltransferase YrrM
MIGYDGIIHEVEEQCRKHSIYMLGPRKAQFLQKLILEAKPQCVVECGTAIGYSGLHIAAAVRRNGRGRLITVEIEPERAAQAQTFFSRAGVDDLIDIRIGDASQVLREVAESVDFLFLDNWYSNYYPCLQAIAPRLTDGAVIVADNAGIGASGMYDYLSHVRARYRSRTQWFELDLPWASRDAMEITIYTR